ncbi:hypothetical protein ACW9KT_19090 [Hymenobacter sp. HD11105]
MKLYLLLGALVASLLGSGPTHAQKIIEKKAPLSPNQRLVLELPQAVTIRLTGGSGQEVAVKASVNINNNKLNDALLLTLNTTGDVVKVQAAFDEKLLGQSPEAHCREGQGSTMLVNEADKNGRGAYCIFPHVDYEIVVPAGAAVRIETLNGNIEVKGLRGPLVAKSLSGFVDVSWPAAHGAEVSLTSANGKVYSTPDLVLDTRPTDSPMGQEAHGKLGRSGPGVKLESFSGDVFFRQQP